MLYNYLYFVLHETKQGMTKPRLEFTYLNPTRKATFSAISPYLFVYVIKIRRFITFVEDFYANSFLFLIKKFL